MVGERRGDHHRIGVDAHHLMAAPVQLGADSPATAAGVEYPGPATNNGVQQAGLTGKVSALGCEAPEPLDVAFRVTRRGLGHPASRSFHPPDVRSRLPSRVIASTSPPLLSSLLVSSLFGLPETEALVILFVVLPFVLAALIVPLVMWRSSKGPKPVLTSEILAGGMAARAEVLSVRQLGGPFDVRPMLRFSLKVMEEEPFDLEVVQSLPRGAIRDFRPGDEVEVRLTADRGAGAVVWDGPLPAR